MSFNDDEFEFSEEENLFDDNEFEFSGEENLFDDNEFEFSGEEVAQNKEDEAKARIKARAEAMRQKKEQGKPNKGGNPQSKGGSNAKGDNNPTEGNNPQPRGGNPTGSKTPQAKRRPTTNVVPDPNMQRKRPQVSNSEDIFDSGNNDNSDDLFSSESEEVNNKPTSTKKGISFPKLVVGLVVVCVVVLVGYKVLFKGEKPIVQTPVAVDYTGTAHDTLLQLQDLLHNYDAVKVDNLIGKEDGDSYLAQEWAYANSNEERENWVKKVLSVVKFSFPDMPQVDTGGNIISGSAVESDMSDGKGLKVTVIDYQKMAEDLSLEKPELEKQLRIKGYLPSDYDYQDECIDLMLNYLNNLESMPTTTVTCNVGVEGGSIIDDSELDDVLFGSEAWHNLIDEFDKIFTGFTGFTTEKYKTKEEVHNEDYDKWYKLFKKYYNADKGKFKKGVSKWEPWYKRDKNNKILRDENGKKIVNYYSVKDKNGKDWIQPSKTKWVTVEKERQVEVQYEPEKAVTRCFIGANYCQNVYNGQMNPSIRVGDGTIEHPAGIGTPVITSVKCTDGQYHDVKVTMTGYWLGKDAIDYSVTFSEKNRGIDPDSVVQLICYEISVENLEQNDITIVDSEMVLCDANSNKSSRTGFMYGFTNENVTIKAHSSETINDWATSTEINQKYAVWGRTFDRQYNTVYFKILAGTGDIPSYSAYKAFTDKMYESGSSNVTPKESPLSSEEPSPTGDVVQDLEQGGTQDGTQEGIQTEPQDNTQGGIQIESQDGTQGGSTGEAQDGSQDGSTYTGDTTNNTSGADQALEEANGVE